MSEALDRYRELESKLLELRKSNGGEEFLEEDDLLDEMDVAWSKMTDEDIKSLRGRFGV